ncbi:class I SAM-dependent RNA methyltransferase [Candidatus Gracilibacteria bacterium]|nr:class I SAM-dependent RNA methyltransferase [Candidatus Gracilibacteria bacterium]NUJ98467.1 class I SAM-dependent RNA methyltransferase [Candidatus Gracilibacteria bacterium]
MLKLALTTIAGVESLAKKEIEKQGGKIIEVKDRIILFSGEDTLLARINLWSRIGNKLYLVLKEKDSISNFDNLYALVSNIDWKKYIPKNAPIIVNAKTIKSDLSSEPAIQKIGKKAIIDVLNDKSGKFIREDDSIEKCEIQILFQENDCKILLNSSGEALHKRGYRIMTGEAPIKENLASSLVLLSNWRFQEALYDPFCGSGTILIEALMIAKNKAPGAKRNFAFEKWFWYDKEFLKKEKEEAIKKEYTQKYQIFGYDKDAEIIEKAKLNAIKAGLENEIIFEKKDFTDFSKEKIAGTIISNPPYGLRLKDENIDELYKKIDNFLKNNDELSGGIISSYQGGNFILNSQEYKNRKLYNGNELCYFYSKKYEQTFKKNLQ